ncbi:hypothetical protein BVRB_6g142280 [Beta vulgaris subsp. vulgaris]|uniref:Uncharacterized protein n=1 Tax=Beta vulgaris subsp. vulgaris TaxID=3555 RepID=A0A0J8C3X5_BETVV|nr:hypothetical protein BVRB_6g142280 [Beta vulgaris subsp. vulgaris]
MGGEGEKSLKEYMFNAYETPMSVIFPVLEKPFKLDPGFIGILPKFYGHDKEDAYRHLQEFSLACSTLSLNGKDDDVTPVIQKNLDRPVTAGHLENVLNDFQTRMAAVMEEHIKNNMLFFQISPGGEAAEPLKGRSQEGLPGTSRPPRPELSRPPSKGKQPAVSDSRSKMDWKLVVRPGYNIPPTGHKMETDAKEYLEAKRAAAQQRSSSGSTLYMKDPSLRLPSRTAGRSHGPSAF